MEKMTAKDALLLKNAVEWVYSEIGIVSMSQIWDSIERTKMEPLSRSLQVCVQLATIINEVVDIVENPVPRFKEPTDALEGIERVVKRRGNQVSRAGRESGGMKKPKEVWECQWKQDDDQRDFGDWCGGKISLLPPQEGKGE